MVNIVYNQLNW